MKRILNSFEFYNIRIIFSLPVLFCFSMLTLSCTKEATVIEEEEIFDDANRPFFSYNSQEDYYYCLPWNYEQDINEAREYPLVIYLHGWGGAGNIEHLNYIGYDSDNGVDDSKARDFQINYPCFIFIPQTDDDAWDGLNVAKQVETFKNNYRIDNNRIYLIGYSMGGSGSYILANEYYGYNKQLFAGIVRLAGQSQTILNDEIAEKTSVWLHVGLNDEQLRIDIAREAYNFLKSAHPEATEITEDYSVGGYSGTTNSLISNETEIVKKTEYENVGHGINVFPFSNDSIINWLFRQEIE